jgi:hypothetical protein
MRYGKQIRAAARSVQDATDARGAVVLPPLSARPAGLEVSRAGLLGLLVREPAVCKSVGLVR